MREVPMSRTVRVKGPASVRGQITLPGDKSISHRVAMLASIASGTSRISGFASSADCYTTLGCLRRLGVQAEATGSEIVIGGRGLGGYRPQNEPVMLDAGNSGSTIRMLAGLLAGQGFTSVIGGDASLSGRPMSRIIEPLSQMGARVEGREGKFAPLTIHGAKLKPISFAARVASAQVKTCVLFAGICADGETVYTESIGTRNHTELMLPEFGARFVSAEAPEGKRLSIEGGSKLTPVDYRVAGDPSSAAFFIAAGAILPESEIEVCGVNLNPTRTAFVDVLQQLGARIEFHDIAVCHGEPVGSLRVAAGPLSAPTGALVLKGEMIPALIDELPMLAVVATQVHGRIEVRDARELRLKESDRIRTMVDGIRALRGEIEEFEDGFAISGPQDLIGGRVATAGDHRIAMAFSIAGLVSRGETDILDADCASVSFPEFYRILRTTAGEDRVEASGL
jgi:3-phosphoshikimate 1-carboxyvinyltransferase